MTKTVSSSAILAINVNTQLGFKMAIEINKYMWPCNDGYEVCQWWIYDTEKLDCSWRYEIFKDGQKIGNGQIPDQTELLAKMKELGVSRETGAPKQTA